MTSWKADVLPPSGAQPAPARDSARAESEVAREALRLAARVREAADAGRVPMELQRQRWLVRLHWPRGAARLRPDNAHDYASIYELRASRAERLTTMQICGTILYSTVLEGVLDEAGRPAGVRFTSMESGERGLYHLDWRRLEQIVEASIDEPLRSGVIERA